MIVTRLGRDIAIKAHGEQVYGHEPYSKHLDQVVGVLCEFGFTDDMYITAGYLHDTIEDTYLTYDLIVEQFGSDIATAVAFVTDMAGKNRAIRKKRTYERMHRQVQHADDAIRCGVIVKLADRIANVRTCIAEGSSFVRTYVNEHDTFRSALYSAEHDAAEPMWHELDRLIKNCAWYNDKSKRTVSGMRMFLPGDTNHMGKVFGGVLLCEIDLAGAVEAPRHTSKQVVTRAIKEVEFKHPVEVGNVVTFYTRLVKKGRTSITVHVEVESTVDNEQTVALTAAQVIYVAVDDRGNKTTL